MPPAATISVQGDYRGKKKQKKRGEKKQRAEGQGTGGLTGQELSFSSAVLVCGDTHTHTYTHTVGRGVLELLERVPPPQYLSADSLC